MIVFSAIVAVRTVHCATSVV